MADIHTTDPTPRGQFRLPFKVDRVWLVIGLTFAGLAIYSLDLASEIAGGTLEALLGTLPFMAFAVLAIGWLKATGAESALSEAFKGRESRMIVIAAFAGGLSPFCSCEVIPFIAALLAAGVPLSAVMAFWLASPLMDPAMFAITTAAVGPELATAKLIAAVSMAAAAGFAVKALNATALFADPLRAQPVKKSCCGGAPKTQKPVWRFWTEAPRRAAFAEAAWSNALFLLKWLTLAYTIEVLMIRFLPAEMIGAVVGGDGVGSVIIAALIGAPAYLNGYAAPALVAGLMETGMNPGAGLAFLIAGGVTCIPAAVAVWALVKPRVFAAYIAFGFSGAVIAGVIVNAVW